MKNQKGITLIALVITIIVLLILAGVTIAMLSGENGILTRATTTKEANAEATAREEANLAYMAVRTEIAAQKVKDGTYNPAAHQKDLFDDAIDGTLKASNTDGWTFSNNTSNATVTSESDNSTIVLTYHNNSLNNSTHSLVYTITLKNTLKANNTIAADATITEPASYNQINK